MQFKLPIMCVTKLSVCAKMAQVAPTFDTAHAGAIHDAQLDYYGKFLASSSADHTIHVWDVSSDTPQFVSELKGHEGPVWQVR